MTNSVKKSPRSKTVTYLNQMPCTVLKGVGDRVAERLEKLGVKTVQDLLFHLPFRYQDRTRIVPMRYLRFGEHAVVEGKIEAVEIVKGGRRPSLRCQLHDGAGWLVVRFFHYNAQQQRQLSEKSLRMRCYGEVRWSASGYEMIHPEYILLREQQSPLIEENLTPIYPATEGLHQLSLRRLTTQALTYLQQQPELLADYLPMPLVTQLQLPDLVTALQYVHRPPVDAAQDLLMSGTHPTQQRLAFEELLAQQLSLLQRRQSLQQQLAPVLIAEGNLFKQLLTQLPFQLTAAQMRVIGEIASDLQQVKPMLRLVQGDVGSGKTLVAVGAALHAIESGYQVALMAPTEILAEQHYEKMMSWLQPMGIQVAWLSGKSKGKARQSALREIADGTARMIVGTHALFQEAVSFAKLALVIVDEQHRFGVHQRLALRDKGVQGSHSPHQLIMTATPIPRTLAMVAYADLDCSIIDELPPGRIPITTVAISNQRRTEIVERVRENCRTGKQAYWVCTLIEESEILECQAAEATAVELQSLLPELKIGLVHGRMSATEKQHTMLAFKQGKLNLLVATTVIEVGVDVPNASLMIIENPERMGLAQLHQLRGRVGRGNVQSHCVLLYQMPLSPQSKQRLAIMRASQDGFVIAEEDLNLRGPGEVLGTRQTGLMQFRVANLVRDENLLPAVREAASWLIQHAPQLVVPLVQRWLGNVEQYGSV